MRLGDGYAIGADAFEVAKDVLLAECRAAGGITLARFRDLVGTGRRDAQLLLERLDADGVTRREGERRVLRRAASEQAVRLICASGPLSAGRITHVTARLHSGSSSIPTPSATRVT